MNLSEQEMTVIEDRVLDLLGRFQAMPFLQITALCDIDDDQLAEIIKRLQARGVIKVSNAENVFEEVVILRQRTAAAAS